MSILKKLKRSWDASMRYKKTVNELSGLTDHELQDIGISRSDIYHVAREEMARKSTR